MLACNNSQKWPKRKQVAQSGHTGRAFKISNQMQKLLDKNRLEAK